MNTAVPDNVDKTDQAVALPRTDPTKAVTLQSCAPISLSARVIKPFSMQLIEG